VDIARARRPFADKVPSIPLPEAGMTMTVPVLSQGVSVDVQSAQNQSVANQDVTATNLTAEMVTIAGYVDISRQFLERSGPSLDVVIFRDLQKAYASKLDSQLISGAGNSGQHLGLRNVASVNTVTYDDTSPTGTALLPKVYDAIQKIATTRFEQPDMLVMHPRRAAWLASQTSTAHPIFQQGSLYNAQGTQDQGFVGTFAGLNVLADPNVGTTYGASTNADEIYAVVSSDFLLSEGPLANVVFEGVLSANLNLRCQAWAYSFYFAGRYPKSIAIISGTGLVPPSFN
jgi:HK97 family phage major capsid protein